jgi:glyoxylase-like metal-dependent hydrolase (beta-lactamase superfamily II)
MTDEHDPHIEITGFELGPYATNCYIVRPGEGQHAWIIDASFDATIMADWLDERAVTPQAIILTHAHVDHIAGLHDLRRRFPRIPIWIHEAEEAWLTDPMLNLSAVSGLPVTGPTPDRLLKANETLDLGGTIWRILHTPGHSPGGISLYHQPSATAFVGDALFAGSIGRTDFPGSDFDTLADAIRARLYTLPDDTRALPGHGPPTTIGQEKRANPYVRALP